RRQLLPKRLVVTARSPPLAVSPGVVVGLVERMLGIDWGGCAPICILIDQPATGTQALGHLSDGSFLSAYEVKQQQPTAHHIERTGTQRVERILEDVVPDHLEIR